ncbi:cation-transporting P-type ATPase [Leptolyngbya sp. AN03gr2]|uniref:cation-transporting P-type ATPase n=1 Tax=unclassified Leptolyngbya TaxID=2650499 RepID=UPI003D3243DC
MNHPALLFNSSIEELLQRLQTTSNGLMNDEVARPLTRYGFNWLKPKQRSSILMLLLARFKSLISSF